MSGDRVQEAPVPTTYLGFPVVVRRDAVEVYDRDDPRRRLDTLTSMGKARLFIRGYRRGR